MLRRNWKNIALCVSSIIVSLFIGELILDVFAKGPSKRAPYLGKVMPTGGEWDSNGFRNPAVPAHADIVAIGDSQTEGRNATWKEAWPYVLADKSGSSVYSLSLGGYGPVQYAYLADVALPLHPRLAIVGFYFGNDLLDSERVAYENDVWSGLRDPSYVRPRQHSDDNAPPASTTLSLRTWIRSHSRLYALIGDTASKFRPTPEPQKEIPDFSYVDADNPLLSTALSPSYRFQTLNLADPQTKEGWRITQGRLLEIKKKFDDAGIPLVILILPTKEKIYLEYIKASGRPIPDPFTTYAANEIELLTTVEKFCQDNGFRCVEILPDMVKAMQSGTMLYLSDPDGHPQASGYRVIGEALYRHLQELKYLPLDNRATR